MEIREIVGVRFGEVEAALAHWNIVIGAALPRRGEIGTKLRALGPRAEGGAQRRARSQKRRSGEERRARKKFHFSVPYFT